DMLNLSFDEDSFNGVWSNTSLLHFESIEDVKKALREFHKVLKEKGILHVLVKAQTGTEKTAIVKDTLAEHDRFFQYFTLEEMRKLLTEANFEIILLEQYAESEKKENARPEVQLIRALA